MFLANGQRQIAKRDYWQSDKAPGINLEEMLRRWDRVKLNIGLLSEVISKTQAGSIKCAATVLNTIMSMCALMHTVQYKKNKSPVVP